MSKNHSCCQNQFFSQAAADGIAINYSKNHCLVFKGKKYPVLVDGVPMQSPAPDQQRYKSLPATPLKSCGKSTTKRQQAKQHSSEQLSRSQKKSQSPIMEQQLQKQHRLQQQLQQLLQQLMQQQELQTQHLQQLRQLHSSCWPFGSMTNNMGVYNGQAAIANQTPQRFNYGALSYNANSWPGYTMITSTDPSSPYAFV
ncbi:GH10371 [Drosophila grimshawi]|uniref:GH10371 n=1 Tax=Drosophila grimshawi TaxID=7222 RepID=B4JEG1_DROGR|nr:GH10371 [Drosophila grimshawi]